MKRLLKPAMSTTEQGRAAVCGRIVLAETDGLSGADVAIGTQKKKSSLAQIFFFFASRAFRACQAAKQRFKVWSVRNAPPPHQSDHFVTPEQSLPVFASPRQSSSFFFVTQQ